nr:ribonuclease H-like domain-containing protein [Tanacetum cinerariifolium]
CFNCHKMGHFAREYRASRSQDRGRRDNYKQGSNAEEQAPKALMAIDGVGWDWSYMANDEEDHALVADEVALIKFTLMANTSAESKVFDNSLCSKDLLGRDFKLLDDDNILLRTPRRHNMYSIDLNNIVPHIDLTCLVAKAFADECMFWHRRLGDLNFKTMNKLVRHNLVRGLPTKCFENDHTCTAFLKGKQHKASCTIKFWGVLRILMISLTLIPLGEHNVDFHPMVDFIEASPLRQYTRRARIAQSFALPTDKATIAKSSTLPHDSAPRVTSPAAVEGSMQQTIPELTALCTSLQRQLFELTNKFQAQEVEINRLKERVKHLEKREGLAAKSFRDDAPIKGRSMDEKEVDTKRISDDSKEIATVLTSMDAATVLASGVIDVPSGSGSIPTTSTPAESSVPTGSKEVPTTCPVFATATVVTPFTRRKGKEVMVEYETPKKQKVQEQIDAQVARELEEQLERED